MLTNELRPLLWEDVAGQKINIQILKSIIKKPNESPRSLIFQGHFGCGKTTSARIMARELNKVADPAFDLNNSAFYYEFDSTVIGNVEKIRELRDLFGISISKVWQVVVFDEAHAVSAQAQNALLKVLEEVKGNTFYVFCTTAVSKIIPTIRSRSLELTFDLVSYEDILEHLDKVTEKYTLKVSEDIKGIIAVRSGGHMRDAHMLLDKYFMLGDDVFRESIKSSIELYCEFFKGVITGNKEKIITSMNYMLSMVTSDLQRDFAEFIFQCMKVVNGFEVKNESIKEVVALYGDDIIQLTKLYFSDWMRNIFDNDIEFKAGMLCLYTMLKSSVKIKDNSTPTGGAPSRQSRAAIRR